MMTDGVNNWLRCRICGKNDDGQHGRLTASQHRQCLYYVENAENELRQGIKRDPAPPPEELS
eukprot:6389896-Lingulodinium_polyedra.AAC.1